MKTLNDLVSEVRAKHPELPANATGEMILAAIKSDEEADTLSAMDRNDYLRNCLKAKGVELQARPAYTGSMDSFNVALSEDNKRLEGLLSSTAQTSQPSQPAAEAEPPATVSPTNLRGLSLECHIFRELDGQRNATASQEPKAYGKLTLTEQCRAAKAAK